MEYMEIELQGIEKNVELAPFTTFHIGGPASYFYRAKTKEDIITAVNTAKARKMPFFVLAGGSNLLIDEKGFDGLVIVIGNTEYKIEGEKVVAEAGVLVSTLVEETGKQGLSGLEWAGGLPGTIGGAVRGNAGAFGGEIKDSVVEVEALDIKGEIHTLSNAACQFSYRSSMFKEQGWVVLSAVLQLEQGNKEEIEHVAKSHIQYRKERHPMEYPNAGSIFKNCDAEKFSAEQQEQFRNVIKTDPFPVVPAAYLISEAGLKGLCEGGAQVSEKHPNYIVNKGGATSQDVLSLISKIKERVQERYGVELEQEVQYIG